MATSFTREYDDFVTSTLDLWCNTKFQNNVFDDIPLFKWLTAKGRAIPAAGGNEIVEPVMLSTNSTAKAYSEYEDLDVTPQDAGTAAFYPWARYAVTVAISGDERDRNTSKQAIIDLLQGKMEQAELSMSDLMSQDLFSTKAGTDGKSLIGLRAMIAAAPSSTSVGRIATSETAWRNQTDTGAYTFSTDGERLWSAMFNNCTNHGTQPDLIVTTKAIHEKYEQELRDRGSLVVGGLAVGDGSYKGFEFKGVPVIWDRDCPTNFAFFLTSKRLKYRYHPGRHFKLTEAKTPANKDATYWQIIERCQLTTNDRSVLGQMSGAVS
jgi:hypothetical protein